MDSLDRDRKVESRATEFFVRSHDFNGIALERLAEELGFGVVEAGDVVAGLVRRGRIELAFASHGENPHIKRIQTLPVEEQLRRLAAATGDVICVYPSPDLVRSAIDVEKAYQDRPYTKRLALAEPQLTAVFFELAVLERYFEDPRYSFRFSDRSGSISVKSEHYETGTLPKKDQVFLQTFGVAYDENRTRVVAVFLRYLSDLSSEHQQIWRGQEVAGPCKMNSDYARAAIFGLWPEHHSVYEAFLHEQVEINKLAQIIGRPALFRKTFEAGRPEQFQPMLRPTRKNFQLFVHELDKMLSENTDGAFFAGEVDLEERVTAADGSVERRRLGSLTLLERWLSKVYRTADGEDIGKEVVAPLKEVRDLRNRPAHALGVNEHDLSFPKEQDRLLGDVTRPSLRSFYPALPDQRAVGHIPFGNRFGPPPSLPRVCFERSVD
jgi:hypothetical protein